MVRPARRRRVIRYLTDHYQVSQRRACRATRSCRRNMRYQSVRPPLTEMCERMHELSRTRVRYGYRRLWILMRREGWPMGMTRFHRLYREEGLALRRRRPWRHVSSSHREQRVSPQGRNETWSMDFVLDELADGSRIRSLTVIDVFTRECLAIDVASRLSGEQVAQCLDRIKYERGVPRSIFCDNGSEFVSSSMDLWAYVNDVRLDFSRPGKPTDNAVIESFNGRFREECLNTHWFASLERREQYD
jgi:putative transposase